MIINKLYTDYRTKKKHKTSKEEWIFKENTHKAIISQEQFDKVQEILEEKFYKPKNKIWVFIKRIGIIVDIVKRECNTNIEQELK